MINFNNISQIFEASSDVNVNSMIQNLINVEQNLTSIQDQLKQQIGQNPTAGQSGMITVANKTFRFVLNSTGDGNLKVEYFLSVDKFMPLVQWFKDSVGGWGTNEKKLGAFFGMCSQVAFDNGISIVQFFPIIENSIKKTYPNLDGTSDYTLKTIIENELSGEALEIANVLLRDPEVMQRIKKSEFNLASYKEYDSLAKDFISMYRKIAAGTKMDFSELRRISGMAYTTLIMPANSLKIFGEKITAIIPDMNIGETYQHLLNTYSADVPDIINGYFSCFLNGYSGNKDVKKILSKIKA